MKKNKSMKRMFEKKVIPLVITGSLIMPVLLIPQPASALIVQPPSSGGISYGSSTLTVTKSTTNWTNEVTLTVSSNSNVMWIQLPDGRIVDSPTGSITFIAKTNGTYHFEAYGSGDALLGTQDVVVDNIDNKLPSLSLSLSAGTIIYATASDAETGVKRIKLPDGTYVNGASASYNTTMNGTYTFEVEDNAGNVSNQSIDLNANRPVAVYKVLPDVTVEANSPSFTVDISEVFRDPEGDPFTVTVTSVDPTVATLVRNGNILTITPVGVGQSRIHMVARDGGGMLSITSKFFVNVTADLTGPSAATFSANKTTPTNGDVTISVSFPTDSVVKQYKVGNGDWQTYSGSVLLTSNDTVYARSQDAAGNWSNESSYVVNNIDKTAPTTPVITPSITSPTKNDVTLTTVIPSDAIKVQYRAFELNHPYDLNGDGIANPTDALLIQRMIKGDIPLDMKADLNNDGSITSADVQLIMNEYLTANAWKDYVSPLTFDKNVRVDMVAVDEAKNQSPIATYSITNIDKVAPSKTVVSFPENNAILKSATGVTLTGSLIEAGVLEIIYDNKSGGNGKLQKAVDDDQSQWSVPLSGRGSIPLRDGVTQFDITLIDSAGNRSETVTHYLTLDTIAPTAPTITANGKTVEIVAGQDGGTGVSGTFYSVNNSEWTPYVNAFTLNIGVNSIKAKSVDKAGNESISSVEVTIEDEKLKEAFEKVNLANSTESRTDYNEALQFVNNLPDSAEKDALLEKLVQVQGEIKYNELQEQLQQSVHKLNNGGLTTIELDEILLELNNVQKELESLPGSVDTSSATTDLATVKEQAELTKTVVESVKAPANTEDLATMEDQINKLPDGQLKEELTKKLENAKDLKVASDAVVVLEGNSVPSQEQLESAKQAVSKLPNGEEKNQLLERIETVEKTVGVDGSVNAVEGSFSQSDFDKAQEAVNLVTDPVKKAELQERLDAIKPVVKANELIVAAEKGKTQEAVDAARQQVNQLKDGSVKDALIVRLNGIDKALKSATTNVTYAEKYLTNTYIQRAVESVNALVDSKEKQALLDRIVVLQKSVEDKAYADLVAKAEQKVAFAEKYKRESYLIDAQTVVNGLKDGVEKAGFMSRLSALATELGINQGNASANLDVRSIEDSVVRSLLSDALSYVERAEKYVSRSNIVYAIEKVDAIPANISSDAKYATIVAVLQSRVNALKAGYNAGIEEQVDSATLKKVEQTVAMYEKYHTDYYKKKAQESVTALPDGEAKAVFQARIDAVKGA